MRPLNLALRFGLELAMLASFGYWGFSTGDHLATRLALGIGTPLAAIVLWGAFIAPRAKRRLSDPIRVALEFVLFGLAAAALAATGQDGAALVLSAVTAINIGLMFVFDQRHA